MPEAPFHYAKDATKPAEGTERGHLDKPIVTPRGIFHPAHNIALGVLPRSEDEAAEEVGQILLLVQRGLDGCAVPLSPGDARGFARALMRHARKVEDFAAAQAAAAIERSRKAGH